MHSRSKSAILGSLYLAWLLAVLAAFVIGSQYDYVQALHLPGVTPVAEAASRIAPFEYAFGMLVALLGAILFSATCVSLGLAVLGNPERLQSSYEAVGATAFITGAIILSIAFLSCIALYKLTPQIAAITLATALLLGLPRLIPFVHRLPRLEFPVEFGGGERFMFLMVLGSMGLAVLYSTARLSYDANVQYFVQSKLMAMEHTAVYSYPKDPFAVSSFHTGILYTALIQLFGDQSARLLSWVNGLAILLLGVAIGKEAGIAPKARLWFLILTVTSTAFVDLLGDGKVELISTAPLLAGTYWMLRIVKGPSKRESALVGLLIGYAIIARPYNIFLAPVFLVAFCTIYTAARKRAEEAPFRNLVRASLWMIPSFLAMGLFHLTQNWIWLGNPLAPLIHARDVSASTWQWQFDPALLTELRLFYPLTVSFVNTPQSLGIISPLFLGFVPFLLLRRVRNGIRERPALMSLALAVALTLALWVALFFTVVEIRYVIFAWVLLFLVVGQVLADAAEGLYKPVRYVTVMLSSLLLAYMCLRTALIALKTYSPVDAGGQAHCYDFDFCTFTDLLNSSAKSGERVFVLHAYRYYLRPDLFACSSRAQEYPELESLARENSPKFWTEIYRLGFRYITFENNYAIFHTHFGTLPTVQSAPAWLHVYQMSSTPDGLERIYRITAVSPPMQPEWWCEQDSVGIWELRSAAP